RVVEAGGVRVNCSGGEQTHAHLPGGARDAAYEALRQHVDDEILPLGGAELPVVQVAGRGDRAGHVVTDHEQVRRAGVVVVDAALDLHRAGRRVGGPVGALVPGHVDVAPVAGVRAVHRDVRELVAAIT